jgi:endo-1,4-beta-xylanase
VTVKKGLKKGTYKVRVRVTASGNDSHKPVSKTVTFKVKVK